MKLTAGVQTTQSVSPQMIASVEVLQLNSQELSDYLEALSYENPMVELEEPEQRPSDSVTQNALDLLRWLKAGDRQNGSYYADQSQDGPEKYARTTAGDRLEEYVKEQILMLNLPEELKEAMNVVVELLDHRGFYTEPLDELQRLARCTEECARKALAAVRKLEPAGVAAESVQESLLLQLEAQQKPVASRLIREHYSHLGIWSNKRLAREMGVSEAAIVSAKETLSRLIPFPANGFASDTAPQYIAPDLTITEVAQGFIVRTEDGYLPTLRINGTYLKMLETEQDPEVQAYLQGKLRQIRQVMGNLDWRKSTLLRCGEAIARHQAEFLRGGSLKALTLRGVAEELEVHESTVSRAVKDKYVQCGRGLLPMSAFFSRDAGENPGLSRSYIQQQMLLILDCEDSNHPLSDEKIAKALGQRHILLSRRAVAKYRAEQGIPNASGRKKNQ